MDDLVANALRYPLMHPYWQSKIPDFTKITVPAYLAVGWSHIHLRGTMNAWRRIASRDKWLALLPRARVAGLLRPGERR